MKFKLLLGVLVIALVVVVSKFDELSPYVSAVLLIAILLLMVFVFYLNGQYKKSREGGLPDTKYTYAQK